MNDLNFTPNFLDELLAKADPQDRQAAEDTCGDNKMCLYDTLATDNKDIGLATMTQNDINMENMKSASKHI